MAMHNGTVISRFTREMLMAGRTALACTSLVTLLAAKRVVAGILPKDLEAGAEKLRNVLFFRLEAMRRISTVQHGKISSWGWTLKQRTVNCRSMSTASGVPSTDYALPQFFEQLNGLKLIQGGVKRKHVKKVEAKGIHTIWGMEADDMVILSNVYIKLDIGPGPDMLEAWEMTMLDAMADFEPRHIRAVLSMYARLKIKAGPELVSSMEGQLYGQKEGLTSEDVSVIMGSYAALGIQPGDEVWFALGKQTLEMMPSNNFGHLGTMMKAFVDLERDPWPEFLPLLDDQVASRMGELENNPGDLCDVLYGYAVLKARPAATNFTQLLRALEHKPMRDGMSGRQVVNLMWACASLGLRMQPGLASKLGELIASDASSFDAQDVCNALWAHVTLGLRPSSVVLSELESGAETQARRMTPKQLATVMGSMGALRHELDSQLHFALETRAGEICEIFDPWSIAFLACSYVQLGLTPEDDLVCGLQSKAIITIADFTPEEMCSFMSALVGLGVPLKSELMWAIEIQATQRAGEFGPDVMAQLLTAYSAMRQAPGSGSVLPAIQAQACSIIEAFGTADAVHLMDAHATLGMQLPEGLLKALAERAAAGAGSLDAHNLSNVLKSLAVFGVPLPGGVLSELYGRASEILEEGQFGAWVFGGEDGKGEVGPLAELGAWSHSLLLVAELQGWPKEPAGEVLRGRLGADVGRAMGGRGLGEVEGGVAREVAESLVEMGYGEPVVGAVEERSGYAIDVLVAGGGQAGGGIAVVVEGAECFMARGVARRTGEAGLKARLLGQLGYRFVGVSIEEWEAQKKRMGEARKRFLEGLMVVKSS